MTAATSARICTTCRARTTTEADPRTCSHCTDLEAALELTPRQALGLAAGGILAAIAGAGLGGLLATLANGGTPP